MAVETGATWALESQFGPSFLAAKGKGQYAQRIVRARDKPIDYARLHI